MADAPSRLLPLEMISDDGLRLNGRAWLILLLLCLAFFLPGFFTIPPVDRDEPRFAQASKQMIETGNYVDIRFQDETRYKKPVGIYWLQSVGVHLVGLRHMDEIWAYRLPSLAGAVIAVLMTALLGSLLFGPLTGFLAAIVMAGSVILNVEARLAKTDAALLACVMVAQYALARAYMARGGEGRLDWRVAAAFWTAQGVGFLIKGPILLLVTLSTLLTLRIADKKLDWFKALHPRLGLLFALALAAPWFVAILKASHGDFATQSAGHDLFAKLWQGQDRGIMPPGLHLLAFPAVFFPGSLLALLAFPDIARRRRQAAVRFCLGWIVPTWIVFELSLTKLPHYVLPVYPAIAILAVKVMLDGFPALAERRWRWLPPLAVGLWFVIGTGLAVGFVLLPALTGQALEPLQILASLSLPAALAGGVLLLPRRNGDGVLLLALGGLFFMLASFGATLPALRHVWLSQEVVQTARQIKPCATAQIVTASYNEPSLVFLAGTDTRNINNGAAIAQAMMADQCLLGLLDADHKDAFLAAFPPDAVKPQEAATITGPNIGSGRGAVLTLYRTPRAAQP